MFHKYIAKDFNILWHDNSSSVTCSEEVLSNMETALCTKIAMALLFRRIT